MTSVYSVFITKQNINPEIFTEKFMTGQKKVVMRIGLGVHRHLTET